MVKMAQTEIMHDENNAVWQRMEMCGDGAWLWITTISLPMVKHDDA